MLLLALSMHGFTEGFMVGSLKSSMLLCMEICVCGHIWVETFLLAQSLLDSGLPAQMSRVKKSADDDDVAGEAASVSTPGVWKFWLLVSIQCLINPMGMALAMILKTTVDSIEEAEPYLNAFCGGTILYVCLTEIVPEAFEGDGKPGKMARKALFKMFLFVFAGAMTMIMVKFLHKHDHDHVHDKDDWEKVDGAVFTAVANAVSQNES
jgi:zinc transporter ZupT